MNKQFMWNLQNIIYTVTYTIVCLPNEKRIVYTEACESIHAAQLFMYHWSHFST